MVGKLIVLVGPSGVGKGTVLKKVFEKLPNLVYSISVTTRAKRPNEVEGQNYFFRSREEFLNLVAQNEMLEWAEFVGNYYGTPKKYIQENIINNRNVILEIEMEGAKQIKQKMPEAKFIFVAPPSIEILHKRLTERGTEPEVTIKARVEKAKQELAQAEWFDYCLVNEEGQADETARHLIDIIQNF